MSEQIKSREQSVFIQTPKLYNDNTSLFPYYPQLLEMNIEAIENLANQKKILPLFLPTQLLKIIQHIEETIPQVEKSSAYFLEQVKKYPWYYFCETEINLETLSENYQYFCERIGDFFLNYEGSTKHDEATVSILQDAKAHFISLIAIYKESNVTSDMIICRHLMQMGLDKNRELDFSRDLKNFASILNKSFRFLVYLPRSTNFCLKDEVKALCDYNNKDLWLTYQKELKDNISLFLKTPVQDANDGQSILQLKTTRVLDSNDKPVELILPHTRRETRASASDLEKAQRSSLVLVTSYLAQLHLPNLSNTNSSQEIKPTKEDGVKKGQNIIQSTVELNNEFIASILNQGDLQTQIFTQEKREQELLKIIDKMHKYLNDFYEETNSLIKSGGRSKHLEVIFQGYGNYLKETDNNYHNKRKGRLQDGGYKVIESEEQLKTLYEQGKEGEESGRIKKGLEIFKMLAIQESKKVKNSIVYLNTRKPYQKLFNIAQELQSVDPNLSEILTSMIDKNTLNYKNFFITSLSKRQINSTYDHVQIDFTDEHLQHYEWFLLYEVIRVKGEIFQTLHNYIYDQQEYNNTIVEEKIYAFYKETLDCYKTPDWGDSQRLLGLGYSRHLIFMLITQHLHLLSESPSELHEALYNRKNKLTIKSPVIKKFNMSEVKDTLEMLKTLNIFVTEEEQLRVDSQPKNINDPTISFPKYKTNTLYDLVSGCINTQSNNLKNDQEQIKNTINQLLTILGFTEENLEKR
jgi:hypothetical protein